MKLGIYCCSNGYGHFHRTLQVVENLEELDVTIHCNEYQYKRFLDKLPKARYLFYDNSNFFFYVIMLVLIIFTHRENIKRLLNRKESKTKIY